MTADGGFVIVVRFNQQRVLVPVLVRCWTVMMGRMVVPGVLVNVQRRRETRRGDEGRNEQGCQGASHVDESTGRATIGQTTL